MLYGVEDRLSQLCPNILEVLFGCKDCAISSQIFLSPHVLAARQVKLDEAMLEAERPESNSKVLEGSEELYDEQKELIQRCAPHFWNNQTSYMWNANLSMKRICMCLWFKIIEQFCPDELLV